MFPGLRESGHDIDFEAQPPADDNLNLFMSRVILKKRTSPFLPSAYRSIHSFSARMLSSSRTLGFFGASVLQPSLMARSGVVGGRGLATEREYAEDQKISHVACSRP